MPGPTSLFVKTLVGLGQFVDESLFNRIAAVTGRAVRLYLRAYASVSDARSSLGRYLTFYNSRRPHSSLDRKTPDQAYFNQPLLAAA